MRVEWGSERRTYKEQRLLLGLYIGVRGASGDAGLDTAGRTPRGSGRPVESEVSLREKALCPWSAAAATAMQCPEKKVKPFMTSWFHCVLLLSLHFRFKIKL